MKPFITVSSSFLSLPLSCVTIFSSAFCFQSVLQVAYELKYRENQTLPFLSSFPRPGRLCGSPGLPSRGYLSPLVDGWDLKLGFNAYSPCDGWLCRFTFHTLGTSRRTEHMSRVKTSGSRQTTFQEMPSHFHQSVNVWRRGTIVYLPRPECWTLPSCLVFPIQHNSISSSVPLISGDHSCYVLRNNNYETMPNHRDNAAMCWGP
jgi:hypothetical protein